MLLMPAVPALISGDEKVFPEQLAYGIEAYSVSHKALDVFVAIDCETVSEGDLVGFWPLSGVNRGSRFGQQHGSA